LYGFRHFGIVVNITLSEYLVNGLGRHFRF
jgi:hypothetical protein